MTQIKLEHRYFYVIREVYSRGGVENRDVLLSHPVVLFPSMRGEYLSGNTNTASFHLLPSTPLGEEGDIIYLICEFDKLGVYSPLFLFPSCCESSSVCFFKIIVMTGLIRLLSFDF